MSQPTAFTDDVQMPAHAKLLHLVAAVAPKPVPADAVFTEMVDGVPIEITVSPSNIGVVYACGSIRVTNYTWAEDRAAVSLEMAKDIADFVNAARVGYDLRLVTRLFDCLLGGQQ